MYMAILSILSIYLRGYDFLGLLHSPLVFQCVLVKDEFRWYSYWEGIILQWPQYGSCYAFSSAQAQEGAKGVCESVESHCVPALPDPP